MDMAGLWEGSFFSSSVPEADKITVVNVDTFGGDQPVPVFSDEAVKSKHRSTKFPKSIPCPVEDCQKTFQNNGHLKSHMLTHTGEKPFKCPECDKSFRQSSHLQAHSRTHSGVKDYQCTYCPKSFKSSWKLALHTRIHTNERPFECADCGKRFTQSGHLKSHMLTHSQQKRYVCEECGKAFTQNGNLVRHKSIHTGDKPFQCEECGRQFRQAQNLKKHKQVHVGEKSMKSNKGPKQTRHDGTCPVCNRYFSQRTRIKRHLKTHGSQHFVEALSQHGEQSLSSEGVLMETSPPEGSALRRSSRAKKLYACPACCESFSTKVSLDGHMQFCVNKGPCTCDVCSEVFSTHAQLRQHGLGHSNEPAQRFPCPICSRLFSEKSNRNRHVEFVHGKSGTEGDPRYNQVSDEDLLTSVSNIAAVFSFNMAPDMAKNTQTS